METRSRKRAEASSSSSAPSQQQQQQAPQEQQQQQQTHQQQPTRPTKRPRVAFGSVNTRSRQSMDPSEPRETRRRSSSRSHHDSSSERGKEKEPSPPRARATDAAADDGDNDDAGPGILHQNFTSASNALQGLLRKLGAGMDDLLLASALSGSSSHQNGRLKKILTGLRADGEEGKQVEALSQLCEMLSIGTEESLSSFSVDSFVPVLVGLLNHESNPDIMLLAARALTHLCDVLPSSCAAVVHYGAVSCFCARLLTIEYMDLAEQSLQALKKISQEHPTACLRAGALMAVLSYLDFFSTGVQRVALSTAANMCKKLPSDAADFVMEAIPLLTNLLQYHDSKVLDLSSVCLTRIAEAFASSPDKLDELCNHGIISQAASLITVNNSGGGQASLSTSTYTGLIHLLSTFASGSALGAKSLHLLGISSILKDILSGSGLVTKISVSPSLTRPPEQIFEIVKLADELLPPLPHGAISLPFSIHAFVKGSVVRQSPVNVSAKQEGDDSASHDISAREKLLVEQPVLLQQFGMDLLPIFIQMYGSSVNAPVRHKCLSVIAKLMFFSTADMIQSLLGATNISSFLAGILAWKDPQVLIPALQIAEILMEKLPGTFSKAFIREGVVHAIEELIISEPTCSASAPPVSNDKGNDSSGASRSRCYRRRSGCLNTDADNVEEHKSPGQVMIGSPPGSAELPNANSSLRKSVSARAKAFKDKFFPSEPGETEIGVTDDLVHLKNLCAKLNGTFEGIKSKAKGKSKASSGHSFETSSEIEEQLIGFISEMLVELSKGDGVSTFEFIGSGVILAFLNYFSCGTFSKDKISEANLPKLRQQALKRFKSFITLSLPMNAIEGTTPPMTVLVQKLQSALTSLERFPVVLSHACRSLGGSSRLSSGLSNLSQPLKLRLCRAHGEKSLRDYSSNIVLIDPLASLAAIEEFLWSRVQRPESGQKSLEASTENGAAAAGVGASPPASLSSSGGRRHATRSRSSLEIGSTGRKDPTKGDSASSKGKGKAVLKLASDENKGPQTRSAARRRAASNKDASLKSERGNSSSEDDELDIFPAEIDDALVIEEEDISEDEDDDHDEVLREESLPVCLPDKVHDVKLGDPAEDGGIASSTSDGHAQPSGSSNKAAQTRGTESADVRSGSSFGSRGAMSFAAAAMAGLSSVSGRGFRSSRDRRGFPAGYSPNDPPRLVFSSGGKPLSRNSTIYQAIQRQLVLDEDEDDKYNSDFMSNDGSRLWSDIFTITYRKADNQSNQSSIGGSASSNPSKTGRSTSVLNSGNESQWKQTSLLDSILQGELPCDLEKSNCTYSILALLRVLEGLNQLAPRLRYQSMTDDFVEGRVSGLEVPSTSGSTVPSQDFINNKLTPKLTRQMQDALALCSGSLPSWCYQLTKACPFLFPFETRRQFFYSTAFGLSRALHRLQQQQTADNQSSGNEREVRLGRLQRQKVRVSRNRILDSATKVMEMYSSQKSVLEVEYFGEVGTGLGPTLEFYTLLSHELQKNCLQMWRSSSAGDNSEMEMDIDTNKNQSEDASETKKNVRGGVPGAGDFVMAPLGLFPRPWPLNADSSEGTKFSKVIEYFRLSGQVMAKALQDGRLLDLPLSVAFHKMVLGQELDLYDILSFDMEFGKTLQEMQVLVNRKKFLEATGKHQDISELRFRGSPIEDLYLDFTLPGYPDYVLKEGEENSLVGIDNLEDYVSLVVDATVKTGISRQMEAFRTGFNQVFDITSLQIFTPTELDYLLCGRRELWKAETLADHIKFDHGYTAKSPAIVNLLEIMGDFTQEQQRAFCQFVTGAPSLPPGGLAALSPKLTIVRKHSSSTTTNASNVTGNPESADDDLPSVMTCANYLKLPPYSTKEVMYKKLLYAINEGQGSFDLS